MAGQLIQVATETVSSAVASVTLTGIDSDDVYMVAYSDIAPSTDTADLRIRVIKADGNEDSSSNNLAYAWKRLRAGSTFANVSGQTSGLTIDNALGTNTGEVGNAILYIYNANNSSEYTFFTNETVRITYVPELYGNEGGFVNQVAQQVTGVKFYMGSGNIASGTFTLYKVV